MNTLDLARTAMVAGPETLAAPGPESHKTLAIQFAPSAEEPVSLHLQERNRLIIPDGCWGDWQNPLNDF